MKIKFLICFCLFISSLTFVFNSFSQTVEKSVAVKVAHNFYFERASQYKNISYEKIEMSHYYSKVVNNHLLYHVFEINQGGYVVVSGSYNIHPVLAYSFESSFKNTDMPDNFKAWMGCYERQILYAEENNVVATNDCISEWSRLKSTDISKLKRFSKEKAVLPLTSSRWNQSNYYNGMCPPDPAGPLGRTYAGCVATAMGQLMYYHRWPVTGTGSYSYLHPVYGTIEADFGNTQYDWDNMPNTLSKPNEAIAKLLFHLGVSVDMDYGPDGSGMWNHSAARSLRNYFKYCPETQYIFRDSTSLAWDSILIANLDQKKPLYYAGWTQLSTDSSGHAFVCDGYQGFDYFHFDWGWGSAFDGYFYLNQLTPGGNDFNFRQEVIKDIYPDTINYTYPLFCSGQKILTDIVGSIDDGSGLLNYQNNTSCQWLIAPLLHVTNIKLTFDYLDTESGFDTIKVYNGETTASPLLGTYSGTNIPAVITANGSKMLVTFNSNDSITAGGFKATYLASTPVYCTAMTTLTASSDTVSDGSDGFYYNYLTNCRWRITPPGAENITLNFLDFNLDEDVDFLEIYDMTTSPITLLEKYTGDTLPVVKTYNTGSIMLWFKTNTYYPKSGWKLFYNASATSVDEPSNDVNFTLYPNPASHNVNILCPDCTEQNYTIQLFSLDGRLIKTLTSNNESSLNINVDGWKSGLYIVKIASVKHTYFKKLIIY